MFLQLALTGLLVALLPLCIVWASKDKNKYKKLIAVTLFLTFDLIVFGAFTRLTDSGLGCPDWPGCYGHANPMQAQHAIAAAESLMPLGPVTLQKAWIEMIHRYIAMSVGVLIVAQMIIAWWRRHLLKHSPWLPTALFFFVCLQGAFGAWTVTLKLQPIIVTIHLLLGLGLLALLSWAFSRENDDIRQPINAKKKIQLLARIAFCVLIVQIALGGWVSTNYAALGCQDFPLCNGKLIPELDIENGYHLWRDLGRTATGDFLPYSALTTIHWVHRSFAWIVVVFLVWLSVLARRQSELRRLGSFILIAMLLQMLSGIATVYFSWPLTIAVLHNAGAAVLVLLLSMINYRVRNFTPVSSPAPN